MKQYCMLITLATLLTAGCRTNHRQITPQLLPVDRTANATIIFHFSSEAVIHSIKPEEKTGDFYTLLDWEAEQTLAKAPQIKDTAVVILDDKTDAGLETQYRQEVSDALTQMGYSHLLLLSGQPDSDNPKGLKVIEDTNINNANNFPVANP